MAEGLVRATDLVIAAGPRSRATSWGSELGGRRAALAPAQLSGDKHPTHLIIIDKLLYQTSEPRELPKRHDGAAYEPLFSYVGTMILVSEGALRSSLHGPCVTFMRSELKFQV